MTNLEAVPGFFELISMFLDFVCDALSIAWYEIPKRPTRIRSEVLAEILDLFQCPRE